MKIKYKMGASRDVDDFSDHHSPTNIKSTAKIRSHFVGWRFGIISGSVSVFVVLVLNLSFTLWTLSRGGIENQRGILHDGDCDEVRKLNIVAHLIINIFSTVILASSNYCMQCLSAPTRAEIDKEHAQGKCYNSVIFASISTNNYSVALVNRELIDATSIEGLLNAVNGSYLESEGATLSLLSDLHQAARSGSLERMDNSHCIQAYAHATYPEKLSCGYSPIAITFVIILAFVMMLFAIGTGMKRYDPGIPIAGSCSVVLSAACHAEDEDGASSQMALKPLQWGVVRSGDEDEVGHCAFSTARVPLPQESRCMQGSRERPMKLPIIYIFVLFCCFE
ncbi:hypothetical protein MMC22_008668 [Lobaria immixta]|nr:hypothetical protein [Lobaria immixta]